MLSQHFLAELVPASLVHEHYTRCARLDGMNQWLARQVVVDKRRLRANAPQSKPDPDEVCRIDEVHGDNLILLYSEARQPCAMSQHNVICLRIRPCLALAYDPGVIGLGDSSILFELVEEVQRVSTLVTGAADGRSDASGEERRIVGKGGAGVEVCESSGDRGNSKSEGWKGEVCKCMVACILWCGVFRLTGHRDQTGAEWGGGTSRVRLQCEQNAESETNSLLQKKFTFNPYNITAGIEDSCQT